MVGQFRRPILDSSLEEFLRRNSVATLRGSQPLVHTTKSFKLKDIIAASGLNPDTCKVFDEKLLYFFVGRPAYQWIKTDGTPRDWELPTCFIFDEILGFSPKRIFPFDSGAHHARRYPSYIQGIDKENFECQAPEAARRIISAFYGSFSNYLAGNPKSNNAMSEEFSLSPLDAEVLAVHALAQDFSTSRTDDRRFSIEIQSSEPVSFSNASPSAVILPTVYLRDEKVVDALNAWGSEVLNYDTYGLSMASYFGQVFLKFTDYLKARSYLS